MTLINSDEVIRRLAISRSRLTQLIQADILVPAGKVAGSRMLLFDPAAVESYKAQRIKRLSTELEALKRA